MNLSPIQERANNIILFCPYLIIIFVWFHSLMSTSVIRNAHQSSTRLNLITTTQPVQLPIFGDRPPRPSPEPAISSWELVVAPWVCGKQLVELV